MSRIYFHSPSRTEEVWGPERHHMGALCSRALIMSLGDIEPRYPVRSWLLKHVPRTCYLHSTESGFCHAAEIWLRVGSGNDAYLTLGDVHIDLFSLQLNTACLLGDSFRLAARIHGQCEIHCYVEGPNRSWLAEKIETAVRQKIFREGMGWDKVLDLLLSRHDEPVVLSYSVCDQFPNPHVANWEPVVDEDGERHFDAWYDLPDDKKWDLGLAGLRSEDGQRWLQLSPDTWDEWYTGPAPLTGFDFANAPK